nr:DUF3322 domain-containing protein [endosymbiont of Tevnia jerichonana]
MPGWERRCFSFPLRIPVGRPGAKALMADYNQVRDGKTALEQGAGYRIEYAEANHRQLGRQRLPQQLVFDRQDDLLGYLRKTCEFERFTAGSISPM